MTDNINPEHYKTGGIETWDYLKAKLTSEELRGFAKGNAIKYLSRANQKGGVEDLVKAAWYLNKISTIKVAPPVSSTSRALDAETAIFINTWRESLRKV